MGSSKKSKKRKRSPPVEEEAFAVELILKARVVEDALNKAQDEHWEYYVKWAGYDSDANTWEPAKNFSQCERLVASFWEDVGWDSVDYPEGTEVIPSDTWINMEKKLFWQNLTPKERQAFQSREAKQRTQTLQRKAVESAYVVDMESSPEPEKLSRPKKKKIKRPRIDEEESDDSDVPLIKQGDLKLKKFCVKRNERSNDNEPTKRKAKGRKPNTPVEPELMYPQSPVERSGADKGKQKLAEETRSESPSSLFSAGSTDSVDSSDEVVTLPTQSRSLPENRPVTGCKLSMGFTSVINKSGSSKFSPAAPPEAPPTRHLSLPSVPTLVTGISTKQRIAARASILYNPKDMKAMTMAPPRTKTSQPSSSSLSNYKFKGSGLTVVVPNESTVGLSNTMLPKLTLNALNAQEQSPVNRTSQPDSLVRVELPSNISSASPKVPQYPNTHEADEFLASLAPSLPGFTGPLKPPPPGFIPFRKASNLPKIQKRWKWEGQLFIIKEDDQEELVGSVVCTNVTTPKTGGMRIPLTFDAMSRLNLISFHESSDVLIFLEACKTSDQFATLAGRDTESQLQVKTIASYMSKYEQVALVPVWYENNVVGHLLIFPLALKDLIRQLEVPSETIAQAAESLIVSLHGWIMNPMMQPQESRLPLSDIVPAKTSLPPIFAKARTQAGPSGSMIDHNSLLRANIHFAIRVLTFPPDLFDWLTSSLRLYAVYHEYERGDNKSEPIELRMLKTILGSCHAREWKHQGPSIRREYRLRVVFIHVGSLHNFYRSPLTQKRNSLDIRFYSYGTDGNVPRGMWGFREIYPVGGVVTLYPSAFMEDYIGAIRLVQKIHEHPLWMAFISPACLGYLVNIARSESQDPLVTCEQQGRRYVYHNLLQLIVDGEIALNSIPCYLTSNERAKIWARNHCRILDPLSALSIGNTAFNSVCANVSRIDWVEMVQKSVDDDIVTIQRHPAVLYEYRRFIVVKGAKDPAVTPISVEATTPCHFDFQDDYFKQKS